MTHISELSRYGVPPRIVAHWRARQGETLLPVQSRAIRRGLLGKITESGRLLRPGNMLITAPTSSGKSFCAEMAAVRALVAREKAVLLFPLKSLAEEKYAQLTDLYQPLGLTCCLVTGDYPDADRIFFDDDYHLAVVIYEKFDRVLSARLDCLANVGLVAIDELQMICEPGRGAVVERLLVKLLASPYRPIVLGLSAALGETGARQLSRWLDAEWVEEPGRPIDLLRGVAACGKVRLHSYNSGTEFTEPFEDSVSTAEGDDSLNLVNTLLGSEGSTLVFLKSRQDTLMLANKLAGRLGTTRATQSAIDELKEEESSYLIRSLMQVLAHGVAFHNADLSIRQRRIVERAFREQQITILCSTTTLAMGVNLPADTVFLETVKYTTAAHGGKPVMVPISRTEFDNMAGRAGRLGLQSANRFGRAIILADSEFEQDILWQKYIADSTDFDTLPAAEPIQLEDELLDTIVSGLVHDHHGFNQIRNWTLRPLAPVTEQQLNAALERLVALGLLTASSLSTNTAWQQVVWTATPLGRAAALTGLSWPTLQLFLGALGSSLPHAGESMASKAGAPFWFSLVLSSTEWTPPAGLLNRLELADNIWIKKLYAHADYSLAEFGLLLPESTGAPTRRPLNYRQAAALKTALLMLDWGSGMPLQKLEQRYQVHLGQIQVLGETVAHLVTGLSALARSLDETPARSAMLSELSFSLRAGLPSVLQELHAHVGACLIRADFVALLNRGVTSIRSLCELTELQCEQIVPSPYRRNKLNETLSKLMEASMHSVHSQTRHADYSGVKHQSATPDCLEIDGSFAGERFVVKVDGIAVPLTGKSFKYLAKLAWSRKASAGGAHTRDGWMYKDDIEAGFNQARYMYRMKNEITEALHTSWPVVENNRLGFYRLSIAPEKIKLNLSKLAEFPDHEVSSLATNGETMH